MKRIASFADWMAALATIAVLGGTATLSQAAIVNTVTVSASQPGLDGELSEEETANVLVVSALPGLEISVSAQLSTDGDGDGVADLGDVVTYSYTVRNSGNVTLGAVAIRERHDGAGELPVPIFTEWVQQSESPDTEFGAVTVTLAPAAEARFQVTYTIVQTDLNEAGGGEVADNDIDNTATVVGRYQSSDGPAELESEPASTQVPLDIVRSIAITNVAEPAADAAAGQLITYTYTITNDGNVPVTGLSVSHSHNGSGAFAPPDPDNAILTDNNVPDDSSNDNIGDNRWDVLGPGDVLTLTATYVVTQSDVDNLQ